jgi:adenine-specific DNA methylase
MSDRRLIEEKLPLKEVNAESAREKSLRHGHISTMHLWWARRPLAMSRAVVFGTLLPDPADKAKRKEVLDLIARAAPFEAKRNAPAIGQLRKLLYDAYPDGSPKVLDCFAGGGAIPLESLRLGCDTTALDLNPVAHLIQKCVLEYPQRFGQPDERGENAFAEDFMKWADWVRKRVEPELKDVFPVDEQGRQPAVYFWARTMRCKNPGCLAEIPLLSSFLIADSSSRKAWVDVKARPGQVLLRVRTDTPPANIDLLQGTVKTSSVTCPGCDRSAKASEVRKYANEVGFGRLLYAVLDISDGVREYRPPKPDEGERSEFLASELLNNLTETSDGISPVPDEICDEIGYRNLQNLVYGYRTWRSLFSARQLYVLGSLCSAVREAYDAMCGEMPHERAVAVATYLGLCVDRIADYNSMFASWVPGGEFIRSTFPNKAIQMVWDHIEANPFADISGSWNGAAKWIERSLRNCSSASRTPASVVRGNAQQMPLPDSYFDAVIIDPPYYYSVMYSDLSDFFYVWLKRSIGHLYPALFATQWTPKDQEVIQNRVRPSHPRYISAEVFEERLENSLREICRVLKPNGIVSIVFAHTDVAAWERLLRALRSTGLIVTTSWPMRSEREQRPLALVKAALASSVVLVCRPESAEEEGFYDDVLRMLEQRIAERLNDFEEMGLVGADYFISAIGPAFEVFARYSRVVKLSGEEVGIPDLMVLARQAVARHAMRRLLGSESLDALDAESLFYLTWRWAYLTASIPADEAYKLERAFDIDLGRISGPRGFARQSGSNFELLGPQDRKGLKLSASSPLIDVLQMACQLWDAGRRRELESVLGATGAGAEPGFWAMAGALAQILPDGDRERTMLLGLTGNREALAEAAAKSGSVFEELTLFDV